MNEYVLLVILSLQCPNGGDCKEGICPPTTESLVLLADRANSEGYTFYKEDVE